MAKKKKVGKNKNEVILSGLVGVLLIVVIVGAVVVIGGKDEKKNSTQEKQFAIEKTETKKDTPVKEKEAEEGQTLLERVGRLIELSSEEEPMIATIENVKKLRQEQPFFKNAENGDEVLVYQDKAIIYSIKNDILVNVGPVYADSAEQEKENNDENNVGEDDISFSIEIRNGTHTAGLAGEFKNEYKSEHDVIRVADASTHDYAKTILINTTDKDSANLEKELGVIATKVFPAGELGSDAEVIIILGADQVN